MEALMFNLSGRSAFFKKPEVNSYYYFTYGNIHKVALLGIFGAILGYGGYIQLEGAEDNPEFYKKLKELKIAICPEGTEMGIFNRKIQSFNNSVGYASEETGGNLIVRQQWLDNPKWTIYVLLDCDEASKIAESVTNNTCVYIPYLGSNNHPASITDPQIVNLEEIKDDELTIDSLFLIKDYSISLNNSDEDYPFHYSEYLPIALEDKTNRYITQKFEYTNVEIENLADVFRASDGKNIVFI